LRSFAIRNLFFSNIVRIIKSRRIKWAINVARIVDMRKTYKSLVAKPEGRDHSEDLGVDGE
jgi:hypothetical protein